MINNKFNFWPVGQGLFYTGIIENFVMVYDIGTLDSQKYLQDSVFKFKSSVKKVKKGKLSIDLLFISHYDKDHISGIQYLKSQGFTIEQIIAPFITPLVQLTWLEDLSNKHNPSDPLFPNNNNRNLEFVLDDLSENIIFVQPISNDDDSVIPQLPDYQIEGADDSILNILNTNNTNNTNEFSGLVTMVLHNYWQFTFFAQTYEANWTRKWVHEIKKYLDKKYLLKLDFSKDSNKKIDQLADEVYNEVNSNCTKKNDLDDLIDEIRHISSSVLRLGGQQRNKISLILYHRPIENNKSIKTKALPTYFHSRSTSYFHLHNHKAQLLTGDSVFKQGIAMNHTRMWKQFKQKIEKLTDVNLMLVPHHGSVYGWDQDLANYANIFVVSYGLGNKFQHPNSTVVKDIVGNSKNVGPRLIEVNQNPHTQLTIIVH